MPQPYKVFTIYAREDAQYLKELRGQLRPLEIAGRIDVWSDSEIDPGVDWEQEIVKNLDTADIILILVSAAYYDSAYIHDKEIKYAIMRHERGEARVLPIIVRPCSFGDDPVISRLQVLPTDGKPVNDRRYWQERDEAWLDVVSGIKRTLDLQLQAERQREKEALANKKREEEAVLAAQEAERQALVAKQKQEEKERARQTEMAERERLKKEQIAAEKRLKAAEEKAEKQAAQQKLEQKKQKQAEHIEKEAGLNKNEQPDSGKTPDAEPVPYEQFVDEIPLPLQRVYEQDQLAELRQQEENAFQKADKDAWTKAAASNDIQYIQDYIRNFPKGKYVYEANQQIRELNHQQGKPSTNSGYLVVFIALTLLALALWLIPKLFGSGNNGLQSKQVEFPSESRSVAPGSLRDTPVVNGSDIRPVLPKNKQQDLWTKPNPTPQKDKIFDLLFVQKAPQFPGGEKALMQYLNQQVKYPALAKENNIQGMVALTFVIGKDGKATNIDIVKDIGGGCANAVKTAVENMPNWKPGENNGQPVRVRYTLPFKFKLE